MIFHAFPERAIKSEYIRFNHLSAKLVKMTVAIVTECYIYEIFTVTKNFKINDSRGSKGDKE